MRGEQMPPWRTRGANCGSPPLARGTGKQSEMNSHRLGITPACAGNRNLHAVGEALGRDHPRLRGEQGTASQWAKWGMGSPPLARGTAYHGRLWRTAHGITPACAGNSCPLALNPPIYRDHPRLRGEQTAASRTRCGIAGSPPLARGTATNAMRIRACRGITPACAGNRTGRAASQA